MFYRRELASALPNGCNGLLIISQEFLQSTQSLYQSGAVDILQLNQALANLQHAQQEHSQAQAEWLRARLRVWVMAGQLAPH